VVIVIYPDGSSRDALTALLRSVQIDVQTFASARDFLRISDPATGCCLVTEVRLPGMSGLDIQSELRRAGRHIPIIFLSAFGDVPMTVQAMKAGAQEFLTKPYREQDMLDAMFTALDRDRVE